MEEKTKNEEMLNEIYSICDNLNCVVSINKNELERYKDNLIPDIMLSIPKEYIDNTISIFKLCNNNNILLNHLIHSIIVRNIFLENGFVHSIDKLSETINNYFTIFKQLNENIKYSNDKKPKKINTQQQKSNGKLKILVLQNKKKLNNIRNLNKDFETALESVNCKYKK